MPDVDLLAEVLAARAGAPGAGLDLRPGDFLPHASPVLALEAITHATSGCLEGRVKLEPDSPFIVEELGVPHWCALEFMSQAVAALEGLRARLRGEAPPIGYLLGTRSLRSPVEYLPAEALYTVRVEEVLAHPDGFAAFDGSIRWDAGEISCRLSVFRESISES